MASVPSQENASHCGSETPGVARCLSLLWFRPHLAKTVLCYNEVLVSECCELEGFVRSEITFCFVEEQPIGAELVRHEPLVVGFLIDPA